MSHAAPYRNGVPASSPDARHAHATAAWVAVHAGDELLLDVTDNGRGLGRPTRMIVLLKVSRPKIRWAVFRCLADASRAACGMASTLARGYQVTLRGR
ncbi:hypothetical protein ACFPH6_03580 [Streptomyces xiangluensis]|uniref:Histidine kinase-, DNA gyrase B-, and HSP90-like ATPase n=1 Tax=Streptomyces xiangluensis TaxID=2665720 RepID=A0ABV8YH60_9ACTN